MGAISSKITLTKDRKGEKERAGRKKGGEEKKAIVVVLFLCYANFADSFWSKRKLLNGKGPFGGNVFKKPATHS